MSKARAHILLALCGLTPQVITETLYALLQENQLPDQIRVLTTRSGRDACLSGLFAPEDGALQQFCADYNCHIDCTVADLITCRRQDGSMLDDILTPADHHHFMLLCMKEAHQLTNLPDTRVSFLLAGGRKTMSACLSTAASCYARSQDSLLHVLVSPGFEQQRDFYYPPPHPRWITSRTKDGIPCRLNTSDARIQLINMPLISLQAPLNSQTTEKLLSPEELLQKVSSTQPSLHVKPRHNTLQWQGKHASIPPSLMALYLFFIQHKLGQPCPYGACNNTCTQCSLGSNNVLQMNRRISQLYQQLNPSKDSRSNGIQQLDLENFNTYRCRLNRRLRQTFGAEVAELIGIRASGKRPGRQYDLPLSKDRIKIEE